MSDRRVVIVDDEPLARERLYRLVETLPGYLVVATFESGDEAIAQMGRLTPDLVSLDISMPGISGLEVARHLITLENPPAVVFCTAHGEFCLDAFETGAVGYLLKPIRPEKLIAALEKASRFNRMQLAELGNVEASPAEPSANPMLSARTHRGVERVPLAEVFYFNADGKYVTAHFRGGSLLLEESLAELESKYPEFIRGHRSTLVRAEAIRTLKTSRAGETSICLFDSDEKLPVSRRHQREIRDFLLQRDSLEHDI